MADIPNMIRTEGEELLQYLQAMPDDQWDRSTVCAPWTVAHLVAHLTAGGNQSIGNFAMGFLKARFNFDRFVNADLEKYLGGSPAERIDRFEASVRQPTTPKKLKTIILGEMMVHGEDIRRAGGDVGVHPVAHVEQVAPMYADTKAPLNGKRRVEGLALRATDADWSHGQGAEVSGPIAGLMFAMVGRRYGLDSLQGEGLETLRARM